MVRKDGVAERRRHTIHHQLIAWCMFVVHGGKQPAVEVNETELDQPMTWVKRWCGRVVRWLKKNVCFQMEMHIHKINSTIVKYILLCCSVSIFICFLFILVMWSQIKRMAWTNILFQAFPYMHKNVKKVMPTTTIANLFFGAPPFCSQYNIFTLFMENWSIRTKLRTRSKRSMERYVLPSI